MSAVPAACDDATPLQESLRRLRTLHSPYTGAVSHAVRGLVSPDDARLVLIGCKLADPRDVIGSDFEPEAGAAKPTFDEALAAALGEAVERYSASYVPEAELILASADELGDDAIAPSRFALFCDDQYDEPGFPYERSWSATMVSAPMTTQAGSKARTARAFASARRAASPRGSSVISSATSAARTSNESRMAARSSRRRGEFASWRRSTKPADGEVSSAKGTGRCSIDSCEASSASAWRKKPSSPPRSLTI